MLIGLRRRKAIVVLTLCFIALSLRAQRAEQISEIAKTLSPDSQRVIDRLLELSNPSMPSWKFRVGDMPHGEAIDLDDSGWETAQPRSATPGTRIPADQTTWYRTWIEIPRLHHGYDLSGARIWFQFRAYGEDSGSQYQIIYINGRRVAVGLHLEPIVLVENARPGERLLVVVKLPEPVGVDLRYAVTHMKIEFAPSRPNPEDLAQEFLAAAALLSAESGSQKVQLERMIKTVDLTALDRGDQVKFDASLKQAQAELETLRGALGKFSFHLSGNSHIDAAWLWPWTETVEVVRNTFRTAVQLEREYPDYTYSQSAAQYSEWMVEKYPEINEEIKKRVKEGRWELVGGMWVEPDLNMPDGESLVRQLLVGNHYFQQQYGVRALIGWNPDSFGYSWQLPQIYKKSDIDYFVTQKLDSNETHRLPFRLFWWESPDGSKVLTYFPNGYGNGDVNPARLAYNLQTGRRLMPGFSDLLDLYGSGDHGGGATRALLDAAVRWEQPDKVVPHTKLGTVQTYFSNIEKKIDPSSPSWNYQAIAKGYEAPPSSVEGKVAIPTWKDELYYEFHRGVLTTQANHKRNMREAEVRMLNAEKYASLAWLSGDSYPGVELTEAWKKVLFNQFHDLAAGSGIATIYKEAQKDFDQVRSVTESVSARALRTIAADVDTRATGNVPILVFNPVAWNRSGLVTVELQMPSPSSAVSILDASNGVIPTKVLSSDRQRNALQLLLNVSNVPSMGYKVLHAVVGAQQFSTDLKASGLTLENSNLKVAVDSKTGCITSLYDRRSNFELIARGGCGNQLQTFADNPKCCDAWNIDPGTLDHPVVIEKADSVELVEFDPLRATIRVNRSWQNSKFSQDITLYAGADQVEISNDIDWHEKHTLLKASFPLAATGPFATYEIPYGTIERPTTRNNSWEQTRFENAALRWVDVGDGTHGFSLINETKYGYDAVGNLLRLSLLRSPTSPDPDADQGQHHFTFSLYPHAGDWRQALTERRGYEYNYKLTATQVQPHSGVLPPEHSFLSVKPDNVLLTAIKKAEDSDALILRAVEWAGKSGTAEFKIPEGASSATVTNLMEKPENASISLSGQTLTVPIHPYEILSVEVSYSHQEPRKQRSFERGAEYRLPSLSLVATEDRCGPKVLIK